MRGQSQPRPVPFTSSTYTPNPIATGTGTRGQSEARGPDRSVYREISSEMTCAEAKLKLEPCVSGTLTPEERIELEEHLAICEGCRLELELTRAVMGAPSFEPTDESPAAAPEAPPSVPEHMESR